MSSPWLVVGLGNPGPTYANTRHNVGFMVVDELARRAGAAWTAPRGMRSDVATTRLASGTLGGVGADATPVVLAKPRTYMNESGQAVRAIAKFHKVTPDHVVVVHDELDLDLGRLRVKCGGGDNGHNGLKSIRSHLATGDFFRVRFGIGRPPGRQAPADYVLAKIPAKTLVEIEIEASRVADAVETLISQGLEATQNTFNG